MLSQLLEDKKKNLKAKTPSKKSKDKRKEGESSSSAHTEEEEHSNSKSSKPPSEHGGNSEMEWDSVESQEAYRLWFHQGRIIPWLGS